MNKKFDLTNRVALITGATRGIGEAIAIELANSGATVIVNGRKADAVEKIVEKITENGGKAIGIAANVSNVEDLHRLFETAMEKTGNRLDILVNNAAANPVFGGIENTSRSHFDKIMDTNVYAPFELSKLALPVMETNGGGSIINIASIGGIKPEQGLGIYSVSKAALISLTQVSAVEWGRRKIRVNAICPGLIKTKFSEALWQNETLTAKLERKLPLQRLGQSDEIASLALFLASDAGSYCTGSVFTADGGYLVM